MTARALGEILSGLAPAKRLRSFQPVRRDSYSPDDPRALGLWRPLGRTNREARRLIAARMQAAEQFDRRNKLPGKWNGPLGAIGLEVLRELYRIVDFRTGRLEPALDTLCKRLSRSRQAVHDALKRLKQHGFLTWVRRSEPTERGGAGPQVRQITNAYGLSLPATLKDWVARKVGPAPIPDCELQRRRSDAKATGAMLASATMTEQLRYLVDHGSILDVLDKMGPLIEAKERESTNQGETYP